MHLGAIGTLICQREMSLTGSTSFGFAQNAIHDFQNIVLNSQWHCLQQMPQQESHKGANAELQLAFEQNF